MESVTHGWTPGTGWSEPLGALDSEATVVVAFGDPALRDRTDPLHELFAAYPRSHVVGCSTSGQFRDTTLYGSGERRPVRRVVSTRVSSVQTTVECADDSFPAVDPVRGAVQPAVTQRLFVVSDGLCVNG